MAKKTDKNASKSRKVVDLHLPQLSTCKVSTCHITQLDNDTLETIAKWTPGSRLSPFTVYSYKYGFFIPILPPYCIGLILLGMVNSNISPALRSLVRLASDQGFCLLAIDRDGPEVVGLPKFEW